MNAEPIKGATINSAQNPAVLSLISKGLHSKIGYKQQAAGCVSC